MFCIPVKRKAQLLGINMANKSSYTRLSHDVSLEYPFSIKHDLWGHAGPGLRDMHFEVELGIVRQGTMIRECQGQQYTCTAGAIWLHGIWEPHSAKVIEHPLDLVVIHAYPPTLSSEFYREYPECDFLHPFTLPFDLRPKGNIIPQPTLDFFLARIDALGTPDSGASQLKLRLLTLQLIMEIIERLELPPRAMAKETTGRFQGNIEAVFNAIILGKNWQSAGRMAREMGMSRNGFCLYFKRLTGISYSQFVLRHRLNGAAAALATSETPIKRIASDWGFCDISHFYRRFGEFYGCTPLEFRNIRI